MPAWIPLIVALLPVDGLAAPMRAEAAPVAASIASLAPARVCQFPATTDATRLTVESTLGARSQSTLAVAAAMSRPTITLTDAPAAGYAMPAIKMLPDSYGLGVLRPAIELWRADDGLFYVTGIVNGRPVRFLVDSGASTITLTAADAARVGAATTGEAPWVANTANGRRSMQRVRLGKMAVGTTNAVDVPAAVAPDGLGVSLLGANWLTHVSSVMIEGDRMVIR